MQRGSATEESDQRQTRDVVERVVELSPQLRLATQYEARLSKAAKAALDYVGRMVDDLPGAREVSAAAWSADRQIHAFFAAPDDIARAFSGSHVLRAFFDEHPGADEAFAVLGMALSERRVLGAREEAGIVRTDVPITTVSFGDHQVGLCASTEEELRDELVLRVIDQLALAALAQVEADASRRESLVQERALLKVRLQLLERGGLGMDSVWGGGVPAETGDRASLQARIDENDRELAGLGLATDALERELKVVCDVLADPASHVSVESRQLRLDRMNVVVDEGAGDGVLIEFEVARIPTSPPRIRAFALVRFARADLLRATTFAEAASKLVI
ncbi:hypothetical protein [Paraburkholderia sp. HD33-4]|uniref:hypothetical protein n=1 Tax=Paraburkholderia sp. HD33-4 TaxID=2883242 RepID=UPI001F241AA3|nr:hypothetical protein [Paraburkholderia sp. HD33-4]